MAPEVLRGKSYTPASDMYSFSMIMWELTSGVPPFNNRAHDIQLSLSICEGERPEIIENTPQCYVDLMKECWNEDSSKRPSASKVKVVIENWIFRPDDDEEINEELKSNIMEFINAPIGQYNKLVTESHPQACYRSRLLDFTSKKLNEMIASDGLSECMVNLKPFVFLSDI
ncbi:kinase-like domain-containing protein [Rhizophagus diaphanus]|nr:kinase-like domain-containing protein [Rhizophagus diaphanus] [Rhizophagus sp. MUCL 43196]